MPNSQLYDCLIISFLIFRIGFSDKFDGGQTLFLQTQLINISKYIIVPIYCKENLFTLCIEQKGTNILNALSKKVPLYSTDML